MGQGSTYLKANDKVEVIAGKDKGSVGKILKLLNNRNKAVVEKVNIVKRHQRPMKQGQQGGIIEKEAPIHVSNIMLICPSCTKPVRVGWKRLDDTTKARVCRKCGEPIDTKVK